MNIEDDFLKFTKHLGKIINSQWSKVKSSSNSLQSEKGIDQTLEEEYEILLKEIDYLTAEESCYISFLNNNFYKAKSSEDLSTILKKHSSEVLQTYAKNHDKKGLHAIPNNRLDLLNYVTEIVISKNKTCNNKLCSCKPLKVSKEVSTNSGGSPEPRKEPQVSSSRDNILEKSRVKQIINQKANQTSNHGFNKVTVAVQTDNWSHDRFCKCGCCPKNVSEIDTKSVITDVKPVQDATTSDRIITASKNLSANCVGESVETNTLNRLCVPNNFKNLIEYHDTNQYFSMCSEKKDCACDAYDNTEVLKTGLVLLPSSNICIQKKKVKIYDASNEEHKNKPKAMRELKLSDSSEITEFTTPTGVVGNEKSKRKKQRKEKKKDKEKKKSDYSESSSSSTPQENSKKRRGIGSCFGSRKKPSGCDEYCLGLRGENRSMQTIAIKTWDKNEGACICKENDEKAAQAMKEVEVATQVSASSSEKHLPDPNPESETLSTSDNKRKPKVWSRANKEDKDTWVKDDGQEERNFPSSENLDKKTISRRQREEKDPSLKINQEHRGGSASQYAHLPFKKDLDDQDRIKDRDNREKVKDLCSRCGRKKRDCSRACRNTIIIPYASNSNRALPTAEVESLKMLVKMQSRETNRQFDNIMSELNHQKSEVRRLNDMYQKMMATFYEMKSNRRSISKRPSDLPHDCGCSKSVIGKSSDTAKECGCSYSNECNKITKKHETSRGKSYDNSASNNCNNINNIQLKRFGPPNTAVAINRFDICNVDVVENSVRADKRRKDQINLSKKTSLRSNLSTRNENISREGTENSSLLKIDSVSTIYKDKKQREGQQIYKRNGHENLSSIGYITEIDVDSPQMRDAIGIQPNNIESEKKPRGNGSSKIFIWFKRSWISLHRTKECRKSQKKWERQTFKSRLKIWQKKAKRVATEMWMAAKNVGNPF